MPGNPPFSDEGLQHDCSRIADLEIEEVPDLRALMSGWGTWIRTRVDGVRVRSPTARRSPSRGSPAWGALGRRAI